MNDWKLLLDDMAKLATSAFGMADEMRKDGEKKLKMRIEKLAKKMDFVSRQEFEMVKAMAIKARQEQEELKKQIKKMQAARPAAKKKK
ncbi:MAG: accessory factor UbiK family protein [Alphaproteobacteria bacterium]|nr:MAG: accessory factor UbiK family protein [Alphaproteobacteria bacterium]